MGKRKKNRPRHNEQRAEPQPEKPPLPPPNPPQRNRAFLMLSIMLLVGWLGLLAWMALG